MLFSNHAWAWDAGAFLKLEGDARTVALGCVGVVSDGFHNPAVLGLEVRSLGASYRMLSLDRAVYELGYFQALEPEGGMGLLWHRVATSVQGRDVQGGRTEELGVSNSAFGIGVARRVCRKLYGGFSGWVFGRDLAGQKGGGFGLDLGALWRGKRWRFGVAVQHLGGSVSLRNGYWGSESSSRDRIPVTLRLGGSYNFKGVEVYGEMVMEGGRTEVGFGAELEAGENFVLRAGTRSWMGSGRSLTGGFGLRFPKMSVGYAFATDPIGAEAGHMLSTRFFF